MQQGELQGFQTRVGVYCAIVKDGAMLLTHLRTSHYGQAFGWSLPGGGLEPHETVEECAIREVREETGLTVRLGPVLRVRTFTAEPAERIDPGEHAVPLINVQIIFEAYVTGGELRNERAGSTDEVAWIALGEIPHVTRVELVDFTLAALTEGGKR